MAVLNQEEADFRLAQRLQAAADGDDEIQPLLEHPVQAIADRRAAANELRFNAIRDARHIPNPRILTFALSTLFNMPQIIAVVVVLVRLYTSSGAGFGACTWPLDIWAGVYAANIFLQWALAGCVIRERHQHGGGPYIRAFQCLHEPLNLFSFAWFIIGNFWVFDSKSDCVTASPEVYKLCFALMVINYIVMLMPCLLLVCLVPMIFCCFPQVIMFLQWYQNFTLQNRGAPPDVLSKLPITLYQRGMFGDEADASCVICTESYQPDEPIRILPCHRTHHFHQRCVDEWLSANATCPFCKRSMLGVSNSGALPEGHAAEQLV